MYVVGHQLLKFSQILTIAPRGKNWRLSLAQTETSNREVHESNMTIWEKKEQPFKQSINKNNLSTLKKKVSEPTYFPMIWIL